MSVILKCCQATKIKNSLVNKISKEETHKKNFDIKKLIPRYNLENRRPNIPTGICGSPCARVKIRIRYLDARRHTRT